MTFMERSGYAGLLEFCGTCCAEVLIANGQLEEAEGWLVRTLRELEGTGTAPGASTRPPSSPSSGSDAEPKVAANEARLAVEAAERVGAGPLADRAAGLVRDLGCPARTGPKLLGLLSKRETEVLRLLAEGLTNAEIAARLYISTKTAGNHVSNVLSKLNLRSRSEAAAYGVRYVDGDRAEE